MLTQEENLVLQTYYTTSLLAELKNNNFIGSEFFESMNFGQACIKDELKRIDVDNQGALLMVLYSLLVVPRELTGKKYKQEQEKLNKIFASRATKVQTTYASDSPDVDFFRHIRNAVAHARVEFSPGVSVTFRDSFRNDTFEAEMPLQYIGEFLTKLQIVHRSYVANIRKRSGN